MPATRSQEIRVGVVAVMALVIVVGGILWAKGFGLGVENRVVAILFQNASGVEIGTPLMYRGVRKGSVTGISVDPTGVRITAIVESSVPLHQDASATVGMLEVMGGRKIDIMSGISTAPLPSGAVIPGHSEGDITALLASVGDIAGDARKAISRADSALIAINGILSSPQFRNSIESSMSDLNAATKNAREITEENRATIREAIAGVNGLVTEVRGFVGRTEGTLGHTISTADSAATDVRHTISLADGVLQNADLLLVRIDSLMNAIQHGDGVLPKLINDKELAAQLTSTLKEARELVQEVKARGLKLNIGFGSH